MKRSANDIAKLAQVLVSRYSGRNQRYENNLAAYEGRFDQIVGGGYETVDMRDSFRQTPGSIEVWNLIKPIIDTHRLMINKTPGIRVPNPDLGNPATSGKADLIEKFLYAMWDASQMTRRHGEAAFDIATFYSTVWAVRWDKDLDHPVIIGRNPKDCYPIPTRRGDDVAVCLFVWEEYADELVENLPEAKEILSRGDARTNRKVRCIEYYDNEYYYLVIDGKTKNMIPWGGKHELGKVPVRITSGAHIRGKFFPPGPVDQLVAVNDHLNRFQTKWGTALEAVLFGRHFIEGPGAEEVVLNQTPGGVTRITDPDTKYNYVQPQPPPREVFAHLNDIQDFMRTHALWPASASGEMTGSVVTGKAVSRLQGVMASMAAEADDNMGRDLAWCNSLMLEMVEKYRSSKEFVLYSNAPVTAMSSPGRKTGFQVKVIPERDIQGYYHNELLYSPFGSDMNQALTVGLQGVNAEILSKTWLQNIWPGVWDAEGMRKEIESEKEQRMELELRMQAKAQAESLRLQNEAMMAQQQQAQGQAPAAAPEQGAPAPEGGPPAAPGGEEAPPPGMPMPQGAGGGGAGGPVVLPGGRPFAMGMGEPLSGAEGFPLPTENVIPFNQALDQLGAGRGGGGEAPPPPPEAAGEAAAPVEPESERTVTAEQLQQEIGSVAKIKGTVYLLGEIASRGRTEGAIEIGITDGLDKQTIINALPQYKGRMKFTKLAKDRVPEGGIAVSQGGK